MTLPVIPDTVTAEQWYALDLAIRIDRAQSDDAYRVLWQAADAARTAAIEAQTAAMNAQAAGTQAVAVAQAAAVQEFAGSSDAELVKGFMQSLAGDWGPGTQPSELASVAQSMLVAFRKLYPM